MLCEVPQGYYAEFWIPKTEPSLLKKQKNCFYLKFHQSWCRSGFCHSTLSISFSQNPISLLSTFIEGVMEVGLPELDLLYFIFLSVNDGQ